MRWTHSLEPSTSRFNRWDNHFIFRTGSKPSGVIRAIFGWGRRAGNRPPKIEIFEGFYLLGRCRRDMGRHYPRNPARKGTGWQTAKNRWEGVAAPIQWLLENHPRPKPHEERTLDYGCGRGQDADIFGWQKYDPNWFPEHPLMNPLLEGEYDFIYCIYVLNVLPAMKDRLFIIKDLKRLLSERGVAYIAVRADSKIDKVKTQVRLDYTDYPVELLIKNSRFQIWKVTKHG